MGRVYTATIDCASRTIAQTLVFIEVPSTVAVIIHSAEVVAPDDDTNEQIHCTLQRLATVATPTATTMTPSKHSNGDAVSVCNVFGDATAGEPTYDANTRIGESGASSLGGWRFEPVISERPEVPPGAGMGLHIVTVRNTTKSLTARITYEEIG